VLYGEKGEINWMGTVNIGDSDSHYDSVDVVIENMEFILSEIKKYKNEVLLDPTSDHENFK